MSLVRSERKKYILKGITSAAWEHPADRAALTALRQVPGLDTVMKTVMGSTFERSFRLLTLATSVRVSPRQFSRLHSLHKEACQILDVAEVPELYVAQNPILNAYAAGTEKPFIVLLSSVVEQFDDDEVLAILGHELGHIKSEHSLFKILLEILIRIPSYLLKIPMSDIALAAIIAALREWDRKSELSSDRAEVLVCQNPDISIRALMKMAGGSRIEQMDLGEFIAQAEEYHQAGSIADNIYKMLNIWNLSHPFPVIRVRELINWVRSGEYDAILNGNYPNAEKSFFQSAKEAGKSYAEDIKHAAKPFTNPTDLQEKFDEAKRKADETARKAKDFFDNLKGKK
jgi:Zn-dependent protease with chaperone function